MSATADKWSSSLTRKHHSDNSCLRDDKRCEITTIDVISQLMELQGVPKTLQVQFPKHNEYVCSMPIVTENCPLRRCPSFSYYTFLACMFTLDCNVKDADLYFDLFLIPFVWLNIWGCRTSLIVTELRFPKLAGRWRHLRYWPPFPLPDIVDILPVIIESFHMITWSNTGDSYE
jgi:hypothetical protein